MSNVIIYHNPDYGTSRNAHAMIRNADIAEGERVQSHE